jgi:hypothetical protein
MTSCVNVTDWTDVPSGFYIDPNIVDFLLMGHPARYAQRCRGACTGTSTETTPCTTSTDRACSDDTTQGTHASNWKNKCAPGTFSDPVAGIDLCSPCLVCPRSFIKADCTAVHDTICDNFGRESTIVHLIVWILALWTVFVAVGIMLPWHHVENAQKQIEKSVMSTDAYYFDD